MSTRAPDRSPSIYNSRHPSRAQRVTLAVLCAIFLAVACWLLTGGGLSRAASWFGLTLAAAFTVYYIRLLFTQFVFLKRGIGWSEALTIAPWLLFIFLLLGIEGATNHTPPGAAFLLGVGLFLGGSWANTYAEFDRNRWKVRPENRGRLYTGGLFRYTRHPNYLGDLLSFSGLCLFAGRWPAAVVPALMLAGFVFVNVPMLDAHLRSHYGDAFDTYAQRTPKLIPFLY
jgi:protein-S-isoprenylcysteine O-methyltransferase Ste14